MFSIWLERTGELDELIGLEKGYSDYTHVEQA